MQWRAILGGILSVLTCAVWADLAFAHGFAGKRFFPATLVTDDPFVADELSLPTVSHIKNPASGDSPAFRETDYTVEISKRIAPNFGLSASETLIHLEPQGDSTQTGFGNLELGGKYQLFLSTPHETLLSLGLNAEIGGTGRKMVGADSFTTFTPAVFYGKGFGDLPDVVAALKPLALTGVLGVAIPTKAKSETVTSTGDVDVERHPNVLQWSTCASTV